jgi:hypothetical protein
MVKNSTLIKKLELQYTELVKVAEITRILLLISLLT